MSDEPTLAGVRAIVMRIANRGAVDASPDTPLTLTRSSARTPTWRPSSATPTEDDTFRRQRSRQFTGAGLTLVEERDVPLAALARYLGLPHARAVLRVFAK